MSKVPPNGQPGTSADIFPNQGILYARKKRTFALCFEILIIQSRDKKCAGRRN
jgi:hypothetical protein